MLNATTATPFIVILALEAAVIITGNVLTIFVFQSRSGLHLKRTSLLLINLAVADLLVGVGEVVVLVIHKIPRTGIRTFSLTWSVLTIGSCVSVMFLALISLERVYAVFWPLRHRVTSVRAYIFSIVIVWVAGLCIGGLCLLPVYNVLVIVVITDVLLFFCLVIICASYLSIRSRLSVTTPELQVFQRRSTRNPNLRLSKTFSIVVVVSLICWLPGFVVYAINAFCGQCFSVMMLWFVNALHLANSMVNPFVYSFRMKIFKDAFKDAFKKFCTTPQKRSNLVVPSVSRQ